VKSTARLFGAAVRRWLWVFIAATMGLMAVAVIDDLIAVAIIALFYTEQLSLNALFVAAVILAMLVAMGRYGVTRIWPYVLLGVGLWAAVLASGVHATIAGVLLGLCVPIRVAGEKQSPARTMIHYLHPWVAFLIVPIFAFANSGIPLANVTMAQFAEPLPLGILLGLFIGKPVGLFGTCLFCSCLTVVAVRHVFTQLCVYWRYKMQNSNRSQTIQILDHPDRKKRKIR
jgi:NhaA family Na+:H+ antiporter